MTPNLPAQGGAPFTNANFVHAALDKSPNA